MKTMNEGQQEGRVDCVQSPQRAQQEGRVDCVRSSALPGPEMLPLDWQPPFAERARRKKCIKEGIAFEAEVFAWFLGRGRKFLPAEVDVLIHRWLMWDEDILQPDVILVGHSDIWVLEIKLRHTGSSALQLAAYGEWLRRIYPTKTVHLIEVYKYWDWSPYPAESYRMEHALELVDLKARIGLWGFCPHKGVVFDMTRVWGAAAEVGRKMGVGTDGKRIGNGAENGGEK